MESEPKKKIARKPRKTAVVKTDEPKIHEPKVHVKKAVEVTSETATKEMEYLYALGRRKSAVAQVRLYRRGSGKITVNNRDVASYFPAGMLQETVHSALIAVGQADTLDVVAKVHGGGLRGQADAIRLGISRALLKQNPTFRVSLKRLNYLHRDPRVKERKKYGLKKARRAPQWAKR